MTVGNKNDGSIRIRPSDEEVFEAVRELGGCAAAAQYFGVARQTVWKWTRRREYIALERQARSEARRKVLAMYAADHVEAFATARKGLTSEDPHAALNAAKFLVAEHRKLEVVEDETADLDSASPEGESRNELLERLQTRAARRDFNLGSPIGIGGDA